MKNLRILLLEDQYLVAQSLSALIEKLGHRVIAICDSAAAAIETAQNESPDIAILDIRVKGESNGIEAGRSISIGMGIPIIYLTDLESDEVFHLSKPTRPYAYLNKPVSMIDLKRTIELATQVRPQASQSMANAQVFEDAFFVKENQKKHKVMFDDVLYISAQGAYCEIITQTGHFVLSLPLKSVFERLQEMKGSQRFLRVSRSSVINTQRVNALEGNRLFIGEHILDIGKTYREDVLKRFPSI